MYYDVDVKDCLRIKRPEWDERAKPLYVILDNRLIGFKQARLIGFMNQTLNEKH